MPGKEPAVTSSEIVPGVDTVSKLFPAATMSALDSRYLNQSGQTQTNLLTPLVTGDGTATPPVRPAYSGPVIFWTTSQPPANATYAGGTTGMIVGTDLWINPNATTSGSGGGQIITENPLGSGIYGNRPATTSRVEWDGVVPPSAGGTTSGGTPQMAAGDIFLQFTST